jgi:hypothetical protein
MVRSSVDLPLALAPTMAVIRPGGMVRSRSVMMVRPA